MLVLNVASFSGSLNSDCWQVIYDVESRDYLKLLVMSKVNNHQTLLAFLRKDLFHDVPVHIGQSIVTALKSKSQFLVIDTKLM